MGKKQIHVIFFLLIGIFIFPQKAYAYLDPGTGSYVIQIVAAIFFTSAFLAKVWWNHIKNFLSRIILRKGKPSEKSTKSKS